MIRTTTPRAGRKWLVIGFSLAVVAFLVALSACGGDDGGQSKTTATPKASGSAAQNATSAPEATKSGGGGNGGDVAAKLKELGSKATQITGKVSYDMSTTDAKGATTSGKMILYSKPPKNRTDFNTTQNGQATNVIVISTPDKDYFCTAAGAGGDVCMASAPSASNPLGAGLGLFSAFSDPQAIKSEIDKLGSGVKIETSSKKIAGVSGNCFSASGDLGSGEQGKGEFCFADNGLLLSVTSESSKDSTKFSLVASETGNVSDKDFDPPYPVTDLGGLLPPGTP